MFPDAHRDAASRVLSLAREAGLKLATAETCTGGLVFACLTSVSGASQVMDRGFILYADDAKATGLGVAESVSRRHGAVSAEVTKSLAEGAVAQSDAEIAVAVTGYAGPGGGDTERPIGTVFLAAAGPSGETLIERHRYDGDRDAVRAAAVAGALALLRRKLTD